MNVIIFGSNSSLGKNIISILSKKDNKIIAISRRKPKINKNNIKYLKINKMDLFFLKKYVSFLKFFPKKKIDVVLYLPAIRDDDIKINYKNINKINEIYDINSINFIKFIKYNIFKSLFNNTHLAYISTVSLFLNLKKNMFYGSSKILSEFFLKSLLIKYPKLNVAIYRLGYLNSKKNSKKNLFFPKCEVKNAANFIFNGFFKHKGIKTYPYYWLIIKYFIIITPKWLIYLFYRR